MNKNIIISYPSRVLFTISRYNFLWRALFAGLLIPLGFAPFHMPGFTILGVGLLYAQLRQQTIRQSFFSGFFFGLGYLGLGVSWVFVSIHDYGHLNLFFSAFITLLFIIYLALYPAIFAALFTRITQKRTLLLSCFSFSALWCCSEYLRSTLLGGFPWLLLGYGQIDTPLKYLLPIVGVYGVSFVTCLAATFLVTSVQVEPIKRYIWLAAFVIILVLPATLSTKKWSTINPTPLSVGIIQANLSMRDKWDETLFWQLLNHYKKAIHQLLGSKDIIVLPESAIPLPENYVTDFMETIQEEALLSGSAVLLGIPKPTNASETNYYNSIATLGHAEGQYMKQHLVPFGEFIPKPFQALVSWLNLPDAHLRPGNNHQALIHIKQFPIASLICYELAYPELLRQQLPKSQWIVSVSDDGWFGHSLAMYQQLQMAQVLSLQTGRYQIVANNDGLSSVIDTQGNLSASLPTFSAGILESEIFPASGFTPWVYYGDQPILILIILFFTFGLATNLIKSIAAKRKRRYPYQPNRIS
jgi:apolipoprotein N-acyltransferase